jgi:hypothetical protein
MRLAKGREAPPESGVGEELFCHSSVHRGR